MDANQAKRQLTQAQRKVRVTIIAFDPNPSGASAFRRSLPFTTIEQLIEQQFMIETPTVLAVESTSSPSYRYRAALHDNLIVTPGAVRQRGCCLKPKPYDGGALSQCRSLQACVCPAKRRTKTGNR